MAQLADQLFFNLRGDMAHEADDLIRRKSAHSIRAREARSSHSKAG